MGHRTKCFEAVGRSLRPSALDDELCTLERRGLVIYCGILFGGRVGSELGPVNSRKYKNKKMLVSIECDCKDYTRKTDTQKQMSLTEKADL